jgi:hypothetical protein
VERELLMSIIAWLEDLFHDLVSSRAPCPEAIEKVDLVLTAQVEPLPEQCRKCLLWREDHQ